MVNKLIATYVAFDFVFLGMGGLIMGFALMSESQNRATPTTSTVAKEILLSQCPLTAGVVNAIFMFVTFLISLPALFMPMNRGWLRFHGWMVVFCALFTLCLGVAIWIDTLKTRANLSTIWSLESEPVQSLLQQRFNCCGYLNSTSPMYIKDTVCTNPITAAQKPGCVIAFSNFANSYLDLLFTALFGIVGVDTLLLLCTVCVLKYRQELERYRHIDEKNGL